MIEVKRKDDRETNESLIRRFTKRIQQSGVLVMARKTKFREKEKTRRQKRESALYRETVRKEAERLKKIGKFDEENFKRAKRKILKK